MSRVISRVSSILASRSSPRPSCTTMVLQLPSINHSTLSVTQLSRRLNPCLKIPLGQIRCCPIINAVIATGEREKNENSAAAFSCDVHVTCFCIGIVSCGHYYLELEKHQLVIIAAQSPAKKTLLVQASNARFVFAYLQAGCNRYSVEKRTPVPVHYHSVLQHIAEMEAVVSKLSSGQRQY